MSPKVNGYEKDDGMEETRAGAPSEASREWPRSYRWVKQRTGVTKILPAREYPVGNPGIRSSPPHTLLQPQGSSAGAFEVDSYRTTKLTLHIETKKAAKKKKKKPRFQTSRCYPE